MTEMREEYEQDWHSPDPPHLHHHPHRQSASQDEAGSLKQQPSLWVKQSTSHSIQGCAQEENMGRGQHGCFRGSGAMLPKNNNKTIKIETA